MQDSVKLSPKSMAFAGGVLWGGAIFLVGVIHYFTPAYGDAFLKAIASVYPGYHASASLADVFVGGGYALVDGGIAGFFFAWLYNACAGGCCKKQS